MRALALAGWGLGASANAVGCTGAKPPAQAAAPVGGARTPIPQPAPGQAGRPAPDIDAAGVAALLKEHVGRPVLINVFASWCEPCRRELPALGELHRRTPHLFVLGINVDKDAAALERFLPSIPKSFSVRSARGGFSTVQAGLNLPNDWNESFPPGWAETVPLTFVYDAKGVFETGSVGELSTAALAEISKVVQARGDTMGR